jgi:hypothetical protein
LYYRTHATFPRKGTMDAITQVIDNWGEAIDVKEAICGIFFDFEKAIDLVDLEILFKKCEKAQLPPWLIQVLAAYLTDREQRVKVEDITTDWKNVEAGVIQGNVLGPILFIIFIADINDFMPRGISF